MSHVLQLIFPQAPMTTTTDEIFTLAEDASEEQIEYKPTEENKKKRAREAKAKTPQCYCKKPYIKKTASSPKNSGKEFYTCAQRTFNPVSLEFEGGCNVFRWADGSETPCPDCLAYIGVTKKGEVFCFNKDCASKKKKVVVKKTKKAKTITEVKPEVKPEDDGEDTEPN